MKNVNFDLKVELGMKVQSDGTIGNVFGQAESLGVKTGWKVQSIASGIDAPIKVSTAKDVSDVLLQFRNRGCNRCVVSFDVDGNTQTPFFGSATEPPPPLSPNMKSGMAMAGVWFLMKLFAGNVANEWLSSILAFSVCGVVSSTVGFDVALFFGSAVAILVLLKVLEIFFGHSLYDLIVLGLICAYHTKPSIKSFDGKPMRELMETKKQIKAKVREENGETEPVEPADFLGQLWKGGKKFVKAVAADVVDANVPIVFRDFYVLVVAEAQFSKHNVDENVFYVGCFNKWFNVQAQFTTLFIKAHSLAKQISQPEKQA